MNKLEKISKVLCAIGLFILMVGTIFSIATGIFYNEIVGLNFMLLTLVVGSFIAFSGLIFLAFSDFF